MQRMERGPQTVTFTTSPSYRIICAAVLVGPIVIDAMYRTAMRGMDDALPHWLLIPFFAFAAWLVAWRPLLTLDDQGAAVRWLATYQVSWDDVEDIRSYRAVVAPQRIEFVHRLGRLHSPVPWARSRNDPTFDTKVELIRQWWLARSEGDVAPGLSRAS